MPFPAPIGGLPLPSDLAPSIIFTVLYGLLIPLAVYRLVDRRSRTALLIGPLIYCVERTIVFSLRALQTRDSGWLMSNGMLKYQQTTFSVGFINIAGDLINLLRCLLVNPTYGVERFDESPSSRTKESRFRPPEDGEEDYPRQRVRIRRFCHLMRLAFLGAMLIGIISAFKFKKESFGDEAKAHKTSTLRYISTSVSLPLMIITGLAAAWSWRTQARACPRAINMTLGIVFLTSTVTIYRLVAMSHETTSFDSTAPGSLNSPGAKAAFYILHALPEWIANATLLLLNTRKSFGTGPVGDIREKDDSPEKIAKRQKKAAEHVAKKAAEADIELQRIGWMRKFRN